MDPGLFVSEASLSLAPGYLPREDQASSAVGVFDGIGPVSLRSYYGNGSCGRSSQTLWKR